MSWHLSALLLLGGSTVLLFIGMPVAFSFIRDQYRWRDPVSRRRCRPQPDAAQQRRGGDQLLAHADPPVRADGEKSSSIPGSP